MKKRRFRNACVHHIYQKPVEGFVIFHTVRDFLVFLTLLFCVQEKYHVRILCVNPMVDHLHVVLEARSKEELSAFVQEYTSKFVKEYNRSFGRSSGRLFTRRFGCAPKTDGKKARSAIAYAYNNAPERKLCKRAVEYRWNLLAYDENDHPFSEKIDRKRCSPSMRKSIRLVDSFHQNRTPLGYSVLDRLYMDLSGTERQQLTDYILYTYCNVDFDRVYAFYGNREKMLVAIDSNTGNEHDFLEEWVGYTDAVYADMHRLLVKETGMRDVKEILKLPEPSRRALMPALLSQADFIPRQVEKYLQLPVRKGQRRSTK